MIRLIFLLTLLFTLNTVSALATPFKSYDDISASIFAYNRIGEDNYPDSNIRLDQFEAHIQELIDGNYNVAPLNDIINAFKTQTPLPENTIALTFDGGFRSVLTKAAPILDRHNLPYTIFVTSTTATRNNAQYLNWKQIKSLSKKENVTIGLHPSSYDRIYEKDSIEMQRQINSAIASYRTNLNTQPQLFAYPYGEYNNELYELIKDSSLSAALAQHSAVAYHGSDLYALPRFVMTERYGNIERFRMAAQGRPLPITEIKPQHTVMTENPPSIGFTLHPDMAKQAKSLKCYAKENNDIEIQSLGENRIELRLATSFENTRSRVNCTMPAGKNENATPLYRWTGFLFNFTDK